MKTYYFLISNACIRPAGGQVATGECVVYDVDSDLQDNSHKQQNKADHSSTSFRLIRISPI